MTEKELIKSAKAAMKMSYSPYSNCTVGAALLCDNGKVCEVYGKKDRYGIPRRALPYHS